MRYKTASYLYDLGWQAQGPIKSIEHSKCYMTGLYHSNFSWSF